MAPIRLVIAAFVAAGLVVAAPFISQFRSFLRASLPEHFVLLLGGVVAASIGLAIVWALFAIRDRRPFRFGLIAAALAIGASYSVLTSSPDPQVAAVERFHFVQYGLITFLFYRAWRPLGDAGALILPVLAALLTATVEEWFQWFIPGRVGVVEDVFLNSVAIVCGLLFSIGLDPLDPPSAVGALDSRNATFRVTAPSSRSLRQCGVAAALFVIVFGMFFDAVHLGYRIDDEQIGAFTSIYTEKELRALSRDRASRWQVTPPNDKTRLAREDQYRTEGIQHVQERNEAWARGDFVVAWRENLILETYYAPVLERGHQWPAEQRRDAATRAANDGAPTTSFVSEASPYRIDTWPAAAFWAFVAALVACVLAVSWRRSGQPFVVQAPSAVRK